MQGAGGALLALPLLESVTGTAHAQTAAAPKRFVFIYNEHGTNHPRWRPAAEGALPTPGSGEEISDILGPLTRHADKLLVLQGVDNALRYLTDDPCGHIHAEKSMATGRLLTKGPSIDQELGHRLKGAAPYANLLIPVAADHYAQNWFFDRSGAKVTIQERNPRLLAQKLFGSLTPQAPATPTLADRLRNNRANVLDGVSRQLTTLKTQVSAGDRARLEAHEAHLASLAQRYGEVKSPPQSACVVPDFDSVPSLTPLPYPGDGGLNNNISAPAQIKNLVRAFACDLTRSGTLMFNGGNETFPWLFGGSTTAMHQGYKGWHDMIHNGQKDATSADRLAMGMRWYSEMVAILLDELANTKELDGSSMLDNTLVLWMSDLADGAAHNTVDLPVMLAGLKGAYTPGRYVRVPRRTTGDLFAQLLRMFGGSDTSFGETGELPKQSAADWGNAFPAGYPLNVGPLPI